MRFIPIEVEPLSDLQVAADGEAAQVPLRVVVPGSCDQVVQMCMRPATADDIGRTSIQILGVNWIVSIG